MADSFAQLFECVSDQFQSFLCAGERLQGWAFSITGDLLLYGCESAVEKAADVTVEFPHSLDELVAGRLGATRMSKLETDVVGSCQKVRATILRKLCVQAAGGTFETIQHLRESCLEVVHETCHHRSTECRRRDWPDAFLCVHLQVTSQRELF